MKIKDYRLADCTLFRLPPMDFSAVDKSIENALIEAWKNDNSASNTVDNIVNSSQIVEKLMNQIMQNLEFQKKAELSGADVNHKNAVESYVQQKEVTLRKIEETLGIEVSEKEKEMRKHEDELEGHHVNYSASQKRLDELRYRVEEKLKSMGGRERFEKLMQINSELTDNLKVYNPKKSRKKRKYNRKTTGQGSSYSLDRALDLATFEGDIDPLNGESLEDLIAKQKIQKRREKRLVYRVYNRIRRFFGYKGNKKN